MEREEDNEKREREIVATDGSKHGGVHASTNLFAGLHNNTRGMHRRGAAFGDGSALTFGDDFERSPVATGGRSRHGE